MAWYEITGTNLEYDSDAYNNLPENRKNFWDNQTDIIISNGIRTNADGIEIFMRVKEKNESDIIYYENELNKTYYDEVYGETNPPAPAE